MGLEYFSLFWQFTSLTVHIEFEVLRTVIIKKTTGHISRRRFPNSNRGLVVIKPMDPHPQWYSASMTNQLYLYSEVCSIFIQASIQASIQFLKRRLYSGLYRKQKLELSAEVNGSLYKRVVHAGCVSKHNRKPVVTRMCKLSFILFFTIHASIQQL